MIAVAAAVALRLVLDPWLGDQVPVATVFAAVAIAVWFGGYPPAILVAVLGYLACDYLFIPPRGGFDFTAIRNLTILLAFAVSCSIIIGFGQRVRVAQQQTEEHRELLRITLASIGDAVIATDTQGYITYLNGVAESLTGWTRNAAEGQPLAAVFRIVNEQTQQAVENPATRAIREGAIVGLANRSILIRKDGTERPIEDSASPIQDEQGRVAGCVLVFRDATEKRRAEEELRKREVRFRGLVTATAHIFWTTDPEGRVVEDSPSWRACTGQSYDEWKQWGWLDAIHPEDRDRSRKVWTEAVATKTIYETEYRVRAKDGSYHWMTARAVPIVDQRGRILEWVGMNTDVTERKQAEEALRESEERFRQIAQSVDAVFYVTEMPERRVRYVSPAFERLWGLDAQELYRDQTSWLDRIYPDDLQVTLDAYKAFLGGGLPYDVEYRIRLPNGAERWVRDRATVAARDPLGKIIRITGLAEDITDRKRAEQALREADRRKDEFLATLAHELRNPLAPIYNALEILKQANGTREDMHRQARDMIERQLAHMVRLVDDLLDVSRITRDKLELRKTRVELGSVIHQAVETCRPVILADKQVVEVKAPEHPVYVDADPIRLTQVFSNLLNNACKYTPREGTIRLTAEVRASDVVVSVKDSGIGIPVDKLEKIFNMFTQVDRTLERARGGLGIGLTLVKRLVEMHGGSIEARSEGLNFGSEFVVCLPISAEKRDDVRPPTQSANEQATPCRILIVDDNKDSAESLAMLLRLSGHETRLAYDGFEAVTIAKQFRPDVMLLDIGLPKLNGYDACREIRSQSWGRDILIVALTGWGQDTDRRKSKKAGFDEHMVKPVNHGALLQLLASFTSRREAS